MRFPLTQPKDQVLTEPVPFATLYRTRVEAALFRNHLSGERGRKTQHHLSDGLFVFLGLPVSLLNDAYRVLPSAGEESYFLRRAQIKLAPWLTFVFFVVCSSASFWPRHRWHEVTRQSTFVTVYFFTLCFFFCVSGALNRPTEEVRISQMDAIDRIPHHRSKLIENRRPPDRPAQGRTWKCKYCNIVIPLWGAALTLLCPTLDFYFEAESQSCSPFWFIVWTAAVSLRAKTESVFVFFFVCCSSPDLFLDQFSYRRRCRPVWLSSVWRS